MGRVIVFTNLTLDGVMQAPGRPEEDRRGEFTHGGWATPYGAMAHAGDGRAFTGAFLFGRRTYEDFFDFWPKQKDNPFTPLLDNARKYVASRTLRAPLPRVNSPLLEGDGAAAVNRLKAEEGKDLIVFGSGELVQSLMRAGVVDECSRRPHFRNSRSTRSTTGRSGPCCRTKRAGQTRSSSSRCCSPGGRAATRAPASACRSDSPAH
jgi:dihydrofolate reductase